MGEGSVPAFAVTCRTDGFPGTKSPCLLLLLDPEEGGMLHPDRALENVLFFPREHKHSIPRRQRNEWEEKVFPVTRIQLRPLLPQAACVGMSCSLHTLISADACLYQNAGD